MSFITTAVTTCPEHEVLQSDFKKFLKQTWPHKYSTIDQIADSSFVYGRQFTLPLNYYRDLKDIGKRNIIWKAEAHRLQKENIQKVLDSSGIDISDIGLIASATTTGLSVPSLEALMMNQFPFSPDTIRLPLFGLGCLAGVSGINRLNDFLLAYPKKAAILLVTELCSLTFQMDDDSEAAMAGASVFGDGSGAVLMVGKNHPKAFGSSFEIIASESVFYPDTERIMRWDMIENGFQIIFSNEIAQFIKNRVVKSIDKFLEKNKLTRESIGFYLVHPGDGNVLQALGEALSHSIDKFASSWETLKTRGNTSAASVIHVLEQSFSSDIAPHTFGLMLALGPAFSLEINLIRKC